MKRNKIQQGGGVGKLIKFFLKIGKVCAGRCLVFEETFQSDFHSFHSGFIYILNGTSSKFRLFSFLLSLERKVQVRS